VPAHVHAKRDFRQPEMSPSSGDAEIASSCERHATANAEAFDGGYRHLIERLPSIAHVGAGTEHLAFFEKRSGRALRHCRVGQIRTAGERLTARQDDGTGRQIVPKGARGGAEISKQLDGKRIDAIAAIKAEHGNAPLALYGDKFPNLLTTE